MNTNLLLIKNFITIKNFKKLSREDLKTVKAGQVYVAETSCGFTATTTQNWTFEQAEVWFEAIESNYCKKPTFSGSDINNLA